MNVYVSTRDYEFSHSTKPRGNGNWAFFFDNNFEVAAAFWFHGSYSDGKKAAVAEARKRGARDVHVGA